LVSACKNVFAGILTSAKPVSSMSWDSGTGAGNALASTDSALNAHGAIASFAVNALDAASTLTGSTATPPTATLQGTLTTAQLATVTIGRIILHQDTSANVTTASNTIWGGVDQQSILKTTEFQLVSQLQCTLVST
jgi:hypothetical protein